MMQIYCIQEQSNKKVVKCLAVDKLLSRLRLREKCEHFDVTLAFILMVLIYLIANARLCVYATSHGHPRSCFKYASSLKKKKKNLFAARETIGIASFIDDYFSDRYTVLSLRILGAQLRHKCLYFAIFESNQLLEFLNFHFKDVDSLPKFSNYAVPLCQLLTEKICL